MEKERRGKNDMKELQRRKDEFKANWQEYQGKITKFEKREIQREEMLRQENMDLSDRRIWKLRGEEIHLMPKSQCITRRSYNKCIRR